MSVEKIKQKIETLKSLEEKLEILVVEGTTSKYVEPVEKEVQQLKTEINVLKKMEELRPVFETLKTF